MEWIIKAVSYTHLDAGLNLVTSTDQSLLAKIGSIVAPLFAPLGFGDWRVSTCLLYTSRCV